jgi:hypothetical protein
MEDNEEDYAPFFDETEPFEAYISMMYRDKQWGGNQEI